MEPVGEQIPLSCVHPQSVSPHLAVPQSTMVESAVGTLSGRTMGIDDSGKCSWHAQRQFGWALGWFFLDAATRFFIILVLPGPLGCLRTQWAWLSSAGHALLRITAPPGSDWGYHTGWAEVDLMSLRRLGQGPGHPEPGPPSPEIRGILLHTGAYIPENILERAVSMLHFLSTYVSL